MRTEVRGRNGTPARNRHGNEARERERRDRQGELARRRDHGDRGAAAVSSAWIGFERCGGGGCNRVGRIGSREGLGGAYIGAAESLGVRAKVAPRGSASRLDSSPARSRGKGKAPTGEVRLSATERGRGGEER
jgi:hypothetical protein